MWSKGIQTQTEDTGRNKMLSMRQPKIQKKWWYKCTLYAHQMNDTLRREHIFQFWIRKCSYKYINKKIEWLILYRSFRKNEFVKYEIDLENIHTFKPSKYYKKRIRYFISTFNTLTDEYESENVDIGEIMTDVI
jgi:hypothetical protein